MRELETARLRLRKVRAEDAQAIFENWASDDEVTKYITWPTHQSIEDTNRILSIWLKEYENEPCYRYGIERKEDGVLMGMIDVVGFFNGRPVIGYASGRAFWNNGYMTEALRAVVKELFSDGYETIVIEAIRENVGSNRVIQKAGFTFVGTRTEPLSRFKPQIVTINSYQLKKMR